MIRHPPRSPLFPSPPLSRSSCSSEPAATPPFASTATSSKATSLTRCHSERLGTSPDLRSARCGSARSEEHTSELQSHSDLVCRLLLEKKKKRQHRLVLSATR